LANVGAKFSISENTNGGFDVVAEVDGESAVVASYKSGIATERNLRGTTVATVNTTTLKAELKRRENSQKDLSNRAESGTIESTQSRKDVSDGKENKSGLLSRDSASDRGGDSQIPSEDNGTSRDVDSRGIYGKSGEIRVLSEDSEGRKISPETLEKISESAVVDKD
jgi:hypothetical protein